MLEFPTPSRPLSIPGLPGKAAEYNANTYKYLSTTSFLPSFFLSFYLLPQPTFPSLFLSLPSFPKFVGIRFDHRIIPCNAMQFCRDDCEVNENLTNFLFNTIFPPLINFSNNKFNNQLYSQLRISRQ